MWITLTVRNFKIGNIDKLMLICIFIREIEENIRDLNEIKNIEFYSYIYKIMIFYKKKK